MRRWIACAIALTAAAVAAPVSAARARAHPRGPSPARIHRAVVRAERSPYLWATVNVCTPAHRPHHGGLIGVRGEMPALGVPSTLSMTVTLRQYSTTTRRFAALPGATATRPVTLGPFTRQVHQGGAAFPFSSAAGLLDATVTFTWSRGGHVLGRARRTTTSGHPQAAFGSPPHHSAADCRLG